MGIFSNLNHRQSLAQAVGTIVNSLLGLVFYALIARTLGLSDFGHFSFLLGLGLIAAELGDLGFSAALVKFSKQIGFTPVFATVAIQRLIAITLVFLTFSIFSIHPAAVAAALLLLSLVSQSLIAKQKYYVFVGINILGNLSRLVLTFWLISNQNLSVSSALFAFSVSAAVSFCTGLLSLGSSFDWADLQIKKIFATFKQMFSFVRYLAVSFAVSSLGAKIDIPIIFALAGPTAAGVYSSAQKLTSVIPQIAANIEGVFSPKFSTGESFAKHFRDFRNIITFFSLALLAGTLFAGPITYLIYGEKFTSSVPVLQILLLASIIFLMVGPYSTAVVYRFSKSSYHFLASICQLAIVVVLYFALIPIWGSVGAAVATLFGNLALLGIFVFLKKQLDHD